MIQHDCLANIQQIKEMIRTISLGHFSFPLTSLSGATIGQHTRHIIEFYACFIAGLSDGEINYDKRQRNMELETDFSVVLNTLNEIERQIEQLSDDGEIQLVANYTFEENHDCSFATSIYRELAYCLEHSIHHQALIKVGLIELSLADAVSADFGYAPATIRYLSNAVKQ